MSDSFTEVTQQSWFSRLGDSIKSVLIGLVLFVVAFPVLWWNEGKAVHVAEGLSELGKVVEEAKPEKVDAALEGKPVHLIGDATTEETLRDGTFGVSAQAIHLRRKAEMYQWKEEEKSETKKKIGGGTETVKTYTYVKAWSEKPINSAEFQPKGRADHQNPAGMKYQSETLTSPKVTLGAYALCPALVAQMDKYELLPVGEEDLARLPEPLLGKGEVALDGSGFYLPARPVAADAKPETAKPKPPEGAPHPGQLDSGPAAKPEAKAQKPAPPGEKAGPAIAQPKVPAQPEIGDIRIKFEVVKPATVSVIGRQVAGTFEPWRSQSGEDFLRLEYGAQSAQGMVAQMESENTIRTWLFRLGGFLLMAIGLGMIFNPLAVLADVLPFLGDLLRMGIGLFAAVVAAFLSLVTIALAWLAYRPVLAVVLLAVGVGLVVLVKMMGRKKAAAA